MSDKYTKPLPEIHPWTAAFWAGAKAKKLLLQRGKTTGRFIMYPKKYSPYDPAEELEWVESSGKGSVYSCSTVMANAPKAFSDDLPFTVAIIELEEGVRMCTRIVDTESDQIKIGAPVIPVFRPVTDEITLIYFKVDASFSKR